MVVLSNNDFPIICNILYIITFFLIIFLIMLDNILNIDKSLFYSINVDLSNTATNLIMPIVTHTSFWIPVFFIFCLFQLWNAYKKKNYTGIVCIVCVVLGIIICDQFNSFVLKALFERPRPCHTFTDINLLVSCGAGKSFPSSHAANSMAVVIIISLFFRRHKYWLPFLAILVGLSRIFVGVHYPLDVLCGWIVGIGIGTGMYFLCMYFYKNIIAKRLKIEINHK